MIETFYAHGKLLLTGEYFVLDGALALALPCKLGQSMCVQDFENSDSILKWKSLNHENQIWFEATFDIQSFGILKHSDQQVALVLQQILQAVRSQNPYFLKTSNSIQVETKLEFPRLWGLGSSSTLIYNIAQWSRTDAFQLLSETMGGSGYDIACAGADGPILYQKIDGKPTVGNCDFKPSFRDQIYFIYLGKKQNSREGIKHYREKVKHQPQLIEQISTLTKAILKSTDLAEIEGLLLEHENLVSKTLKLPRIQDQYFPDFQGVVKSLGAWGGDFVLATSDLGELKTRAYFNEKGFDVFLKYDDLIL
jgi:mevalonate kinase